MKEIKLTKNKVTIIDSNLFNYINQWKWSYLNSGYAMRTHYISWNNKTKKQKQEVIYMHRFIMNAPKGMEVDHINGDKLDNRKKNLRLVTSQQNKMNQKLNKKNTSGFKGVTWEKRVRKWRVVIKKDKKQIHLGYFKNIKDAAKAYNESAKEYFGEFAKLNRL